MSLKELAAVAAEEARADQAHRLAEALREQRRARIRPLWLMLMLVSTAAAVVVAAMFFMGRLPRQDVWVWIGGCAGAWWFAMWRFIASGRRRRRRRAVAF